MSQITSTRIPQYPKYIEFTSDDVDYWKACEDWATTVANELKPDEVETLLGIVRFGPLYDGEVCSKAARNELLDMGLAVKHVVSGKAMPKACPPYGVRLTNGESAKGYCEGYQSATYSGSSVYRKLVELGKIKE